MDTCCDIKVDGVQGRVAVLNHTATITTLSLNISQRRQPVCVRALKEELIFKLQKKLKLQTKF